MAEDFNNKIIDSGYLFGNPSSYDIFTGDMQVISENISCENRRRSSMENILDAYIQSKAVPLVLRKRLLYERSIHQI